MTVASKAPATGLRGGPDSAALILHHARRLARRFDRADELGAFGISLFGVYPQGPTREALLAGPLASYACYHEVDLTAVTQAGFEFWPTFRHPHVTLLLPDDRPATAQRLLVLLGPVRQNPAYEERSDR